MKQQNFLERLQSLHPTHKSRILVVVAIISTISFGSMWVNNIKNELVGIDTNELIPQSGTVLSATNYVTLESTEIKNDKRYLYFKVENNTDDILNFSTPEKISMNLGDGEVQPEEIYDRQQTLFPTKILSNTTVYGTLVLPTTDGEAGTIVFDDLYFETSPDQLFKESMQIDFETLKTVEELRS